MIIRRNLSFLYREQSEVESMFPVLPRQWVSVCQLPATITRLCHHYVTVSSQHIEVSHHYVWSVSSHDIETGLTLHM